MATKPPTREYLPTFDGPFLRGKCGVNIGKYSSTMDPMGLNIVTSMIAPIVAYKICNIYGFNLWGSFQSHGGVPQ